ncbi:histidyl-trna synthetase [Curvularia clavata]|uniref:Histidine--tRNA ligase, mitochondrial n=1 Tax=Curvularia clavata TaxID=95742 RepID=A0A9Q9DY63_CURCL|nr:histidyl-trna synthetase [Curvularia clavata]
MSGLNLAVTKDGETYNKLSRPDDYLVSAQHPPLFVSAVSASAISGSKRKHEYESAFETKRAKTDRKTSRSKIRGRVNDQFREPGVRSVLPGLEGEEQLTDESIDEAVAYLRSVRSEASAIPTLLVAPNDPYDTDSDSNDASNSNEKLNLEAQRVVYNDGTWVALESEGDNASEYWDGDTNDLDPQESCQWILVQRFCSLRSRLSSIRGRTLPLNEAKSSRKQKRTEQSNKHQWAETIGRDYPALEEVTQMDESTLYVALHGCALALDRSTEVSRQKSCWIWTLLALTGDFGTLDHERIGKIRDLGLAASRLAKRFYASRIPEEQRAPECEAHSNRGSGVEDGELSDSASRKEDCNGKPDADNNLESGEIADDNTDDSGAEMMISDDEAGSSDALEGGALEKARARLLAQLGDRLVQPAVPSSNLLPEPVPASNFRLLSRAEAERQRQEIRNNKPQTEDVARASASTSDPVRIKRPAPDSTPLTESELETKAAIDMILTVVAECYGQRDLLEFRGACVFTAQPWIAPLSCDPMPRISPHFVCPALLQDALRYTFAYRKFTPTPTAFRVRLCISRRRLCTQASPLIDDEMGKEDKSKNFNLKVPKGTRDWTGEDAALRDRLFDTVTDVFKRHGATTLDTPVFELKEILSGKYGEDSKLIYDLQDQGGELCSLRYDLTVPLARWLAMNPSVQSFKRYQIAKVYRRDQPAMTKGRMREFYQCDFDIAGSYDTMIPDAEVLKIATDVFDSLEWDTYTIKINHRKILDGIFKAAGVKEELIRPISSAVDKLDKMPWEEVKKEMETKGLATEVADKIGEWVQRKGGDDIIEYLKTNEELSKSEDVRQGVQEMELLFAYLDAFGARKRISFDLSLARGLDYYTGLIYEVVTEGSAPRVQGQQQEIGVGSVAAGGRYDQLVGMFSGKPIPCVGISFGIDRIISIMKARGQSTQRAKEVDAFVMAFGGKGFNGMLTERMQVAQELWAAGIKAEFSYKLKPKVQQQFKQAEVAGVPLAVILGEDELKDGKVKIKVLGIKDENDPEKDGVLVDRSSMVEEIRKRL